MAQTSAAGAALAISVSISGNPLAVKFKVHELFESSGWIMLFVSIKYFVYSFFNFFVCESLKSGPGGKFVSNDAFVNL